jgi:sulfur-oxidizing protein SoxY
VKRREILRMAVLSALPFSHHAMANESAFDKAVRDFLNGATPKESGIALHVEPLVDNGNSVPVKVTVDHPMSASSHIATIALFTERNPQPDVAVFQLGPHNGRAEISTRIRLAGTQRIAALARASDGRCYLKSVEVIVTAAACAEMD